MRCAVFSRSTWNVLAKSRQSYPTDQLLGVLGMRVLREARKDVRPESRFPATGHAAAGPFLHPDVRESVPNPIPAIVIAHPYGRIEEKAAGLDAQRLSIGWT